MTAWGDDIRAEVARALRDMGGAGLPGEGSATNATLSRSTPGAYNPSTGAASLTVETWAVVAVVAEEPVPPDATMTVRPRITVTIPAGDYEVRENDELTVGSLTYTVLAVRAPQMAGAVSAWVADLRR